MAHQGENVEKEQAPRLCANGCGFFANQACLDMCSKCYRETSAKHDTKVANEKAAAAALSQSLPAPAAPPATLAPPVARARPSPAAEAAAPRAEDCTVFAVPSTSEAAGPGKAGLPADERPVQKNPGRCFTCNKRVGLTGFKCRCEYVFCANHRLAEAHQCGFDYKAMERRRLEKNNPLVQASKVGQF